MARFSSFTMYRMRFCAISIFRYIYVCRHPFSFLLCKLNTNAGFMRIKWNERVEVYTFVCIWLGLQHAHAHNSTCATALFPSTAFVVRITISFFFLLLSSSFASIELCLLVTVSIRRHSFIVIFFFIKYTHLLWIHFPNLNSLNDTNHLLLLCFDVLMSTTWLTFSVIIPPILVFYYGLFFCFLVLHSFGNSIIQMPVGFYIKSSQLKKKNLTQTFYRKK